MQQPCQFHQEDSKRDRDRYGQKPPACLHGWRKGVDKTGPQPLFPEDFMSYSHKSSIAVTQILSKEKANFVDFLNGLRVIAG
jgi:hypothetical protein